MLQIKFTVQVTTLPNCDDITRFDGTEFTREPPELVQHFSFIGGVHIVARALHVLSLIWFGCIARLSQWGGGGGNFLIQIIST